ncbi:MAG: NfeD family protein [Actinomycetota bacterium]
MRGLRFVLVVLTLSVLFVGAVSAQSGDDSVVVIEVEGPLDQRSLDYVETSLAAESVHVFVVKIDSPGISSGNILRVFDAFENADAPVVAWIGPFGAEAFGGAAYLANFSDERFAAPGARVGYLEPVVQQGTQDLMSRWVEGMDEVAEKLLDTTIEITRTQETIPGFVDAVEPALGGLIISLDGATVTRGARTWELSTARTEVINGEEILVSSRNVVFVKAGLLDRFLHLSSRPGTAFLFLLMGLAFAAFEFYAAGRGLMAAVASVAILLSGYGLATLPIWWPSLVIVLVGIALLVWGFSQNRVDWRAILGTLLLLVAGLTFTTSRPAYPPVIWMVLLAVAASVTFIWYSLTTVVRGRFATPTVGREELLGQRCLAVSDLDPEGIVMVGAARWRATADRGVVIRSGAVAEVVGVTGLVLEVDPVGRGREEI